MDEALYYLTEAQMHIDAFIDIPLADSIFEATDDAKEANKSNEVHKQGALESLQKAFKTIIDKLKEAFERISNGIKLMFMSKEEKARYDEFVDMVNKDPELAKKKVTVVDFREYEKAYNEALKKLEDEAKKPNPSVGVAENIIGMLQGKLKEIGDTASGAASRAALSVTMKTALEIADRNSACAKAINAAIKKEIISMEAIEKELGEKRAAKFEKKIEQLANAGKIHRMMSKLLHKKEQDLQSIIRKQATNLMSFTNYDNPSKGSVVDAKSVLRGARKNPGLLLDAAGGPKNAAKMAKDMAVTAVKAKKFEMKAKKTVKNAKREGKDLKDFILGSH